MATDIVRSWQHARHHPQAQTLTQAYGIVHIGSVLPTRNDSNNPRFFSLSIILLLYAYLWNDSWSCKNEIFLALSLLTFLQLHCFGYECVFFAVCAHEKYRKKDSCSCNNTISADAKCISLEQNKIGKTMDAQCAKCSLSLLASLYREPLNISAQRLCCLVL